MSLETEKRKVEEELEAERALALDKDDLLERSKKREGELEEEVTALQADLDNLDSQLDRALKIQKTSEEKYDSLREAFDQAAEHLVRLETEQREWATKETQLAGLIDGTNEEIEHLRGENGELQKLSEELRNLASQLEEDLLRAKERMELSTIELETKLNTEFKNRCLLSTSRRTVTDADVEIFFEVRRTILKKMLAAQRSSWLRWLGQRPSTERLSRQKRMMSCAWYLTYSHRSGNLDKLSKIPQSCKARLTP